MIAARLTPISELRDGYRILADALLAAGLPRPDLDDGPRLYGLDQGAGPIAFGGLEGDGPDQLLRSVVVLPDRRGSGRGQALVAALADQAQREGVQRLWLLTTTAEPFFARHGWAVRARSEAPAAIAASREFASLCPQTAVLMCRTLA